MQTVALEHVLHFDREEVQTVQAPADKNEPEMQEEQTVKKVQVLQLGISEAHVTHFDKDNT